MSTLRTGYGVTIGRRCKKSGKQPEKILEIKLESILEGTGSDLIEGTIKEETT